MLLSALLAGQTLRALRKLPSQRDLWLMIAATGALLLVSRVLAVPGSPFLGNNSDMLVIPVAAGWAVWSARFVAPIPVLLVVLASWTGDAGVLAVEQAALAAEEAELRAANAVHDDVLSVLRAVGEADRPVPWSLVVSKAKEALDALARQVPRSRPGLADLGSALRRQASGPRRAHRPKQPVRPGYGDRIR